MGQVVELAVVQFARRALYVVILDALGDKTCQFVKVRVQGLHLGKFRKPGNRRIARRIFQPFAERTQVVLGNGGLLGRSQLKR